MPPFKNQGGRVGFVAAGGKNPGATWTGTLSAG
jgi:hypothetical protein